MSLSVQIHFSPDQLKNSFLLCCDTHNKALLIDPQHIDVPLFELLESQKKDLAGVLFTHLDANAAKTLRTLKKIYSFKIFGADDSLEGIPVQNVRQEEKFECGNMTINPFFIPGLYGDSLAYKIQDFLFVGDILSAGLVHEADKGYGQALLITCIKETLVDLAPQTLVLPSQGPASTVEAELGANRQILNPPDL